MDTVAQIDITQLIQYLGYGGIFLTIVFESGLLFGFLLPGDGLVFTAGLLASQNILNIWVLVPLFVVAAILGDSLAYWTGRKFGGWVLQKKDSKFFSKDRLERAQLFYEQHGRVAIVFARFIPAVRTLVPMVAGMVGMPYKTFLGVSMVGGFLWGFIITMLGFMLGNAVPNASRYLFPLIGVLVIVWVMLTKLKKSVVEEKNNKV